MARSATEWAQLVRAPLAQLRAEVWKALNTAKNGSSPDDDLSWPELIKLWRNGEDDKTVLARWRRGLDTENFPIEISTIGEALEALSHVRDRLPARETPHVRRLLHDEVNPANRILQIFYPNPKSVQDVSGLLGTWRLVHQQSDGTGFISWKVVISPSIEPSGGPDAWFEMETNIPTTSLRKKVNGVSRITHSAKGAVHGVGTMFYLVGADQEHQVVTASFECPRGQVPANSFDRAQGLIQRIGTLGLYAACAVFTRTDLLSDNEIGRYKLDDVTSGIFDGLAEDMTLIASDAERTGIPACLVSSRQAHGL